MPDNKPNFLKNTSDDISLEEASKVFEGSEETPEDATPEVEEEKDEAVKTDKKPEEQPTEQPEGDEPDKTKDTPDNETDNKDDKPTKPKADDKKEPDKKEPEEKPETKLVFGKYKSIEDAESAFKEMQTALVRAQTKAAAYARGEIPPTIDGKELEIQKLLRTPLINPPRIDATKYVGEDGTVDLNSLLNDYTTGLTMAIQKSLLGGALAAAQFGILKQSITEEHEARLSGAQREETARSIESKLMTDFPVLKDNEELQKVVAQAIIGAKKFNQEEAEKAGKEVSEMGYDDYVALVSTIVGSRPGEGKTADDPTEKIKPSPSITGTSVPGPVDDMDETIAGMEKVGTKWGF